MSDIPPFDAAAACPPHAVVLEREADGAIRLRSKVALGEVAPSTGAWLHRWAEARPEAVFLAERSGAGWREATYAETLQRVRALAAGLLARGLGPDRPVVCLSGAGVDHGLLALAGQYVGIPTVPVAEQYSLIPGAHRRLVHVMERVRPALAFAADAGRFHEALALSAFDGVEIVARRGEGAPRPVTPFEALMAERADVDAARRRVGPDTIAKYLFTSGSTSDPKGVVTTQRMMCVNQAQIAAALPFIARRPPKILDWLPWNHVFGGSHNFNMMLANGGSLYIDDGRPTEAAFPRTLENLAMHAGTLSFNVPIGFKLLLAALGADPALRRRFFADLDMIFYAGASLPADVWTGLQDLARAETGRVPLMTSSWGMTETAPAAVIVHERVDRAGRIGVPLPEVTVKMVPAGGERYELRVKGPNVMPGYLKDAERTAAAFDPEGFLVTGDAVRFFDPAEADRGLVFDGRISEDFKLMTGTLVEATRIHAEALRQLADLATDLVVCGHDRPEIGLLVFPARERIAAAGLPFREDGDALSGAALTEAVRNRLAAASAAATGSSTRIARALVMAEPPSVAGQEITDKGSLNSRNIRARRAALVDRLYDDGDPAVILI